MKKILVLSILSAGVLSLALISPVAAKTSSATTASATDNSVTVPVSSSVPAPTPPAVPITSSVPVSSSVVAPVAPTAPTAVPAGSSTAPMATPKAADLSADSVKAANLTLSHAHVTVSGDTIDVFLTVKNAGSNDERIIGAGTPWDKAEVVMVTKPKDGKETEAPLTIALPAGKTTEISKDETWIRVKGVSSKDKSGGLLPITFYFRGAPNTELKLSLKGEGAGSSIMNWFSK